MLNPTPTLRTRLIAFWEQLRTNFWFVPVLMSAAAALLALAMIGLDSALSDEAIDGLIWVYSGGPEGARSLLSTVASSAITVAGTTFSITIAALTLASSQFGPRLLRMFVRDTGNQVVLGTFVATFLYCLLVLRTIRGLEDVRVVPHLSVTVGVLLAIADLGVLIYFINHVAMGIRADQVIAAVGHDLDTAIERLFPAQIGRASEAHDGREPPALVPPQLEQTGRPILAADHGYLVVIDIATIGGLAVREDLLLRLERRPGDFVMDGDTLALAWPPERASDKVCRALRSAFILAAEHSTQQDVIFAVNQLVEIAVRALSPGVNDPFTAVACVDRLGAALRRVAERPFPEARRFDEHGKLRMIAEPISFNDLVGASFDQIRAYGRDNIQVVLHLLDTLARIGARTDNAERRDVLANQAALAFEGSRAALTTEADRRRLEEHYQATLVELSGEVGTAGI